MVRRRSHPLHAVDKVSARGFMLSGSVLDLYRGQRVYFEEELHVVPEITVISVRHRWQKPQRNSRRIHEQ